MLKNKKLIIIAVLAAGSSLAFADKLSDFTDADRYEEGCVTIPAIYSSERSACDREGPNVHPWCDGKKGPVTCGSEEETRKPKRDIENAKKLISDLKDKKSKAESNKSNAKTDDEKRKFEDEIKQLDKDLSDADKALEAANNALEARKTHVNSAIETLDRCIAYRRAVQNSFASALDKMRNESETPEIKKLSSSLVRKYEKAKSGHEEQITARTNAWNNCKSWRP
jgi:DNA repair exonuclease SbcCD ATPase subunit